VGISAIGPQEPDFRENLDAFEGRPIDTIVVETRNIFDTRSERYNNFVFRLANRIHIVTREDIVREELLLSPGEPFDPELARETVRNLRSRKAIYNAWWTVETGEGGNLLLTLTTVDQWSLTGGLSLQGDGSGTDVTVGFEERNFLGRHQLVSLDYVHQQDDEDYVMAGFLDRRFWSRQIALELEYNDDPTNRERRAIIGRPYYDLSQDWAFEFEVANRSVRRDIYNDDGVLAARSWSRGDVARTEIRYRWGSYKRKIGVALSHEYRFEDAYAREISPGFEEGAINFPTDSAVHQVQGSFFLEHVDFTTATRIDGFDQIEDITLGTQGSVFLGRAFRPSFTDYDYDFGGFRVSWVHGIRSTFFFADYERIFWFRRDADLRRTSEMSLRIYNNYLPFVTFAGRLYYRRDWRSDRTAPLLLGGKTGLRGFSTKFRTGDQMAVMNLETRFFPGLEILSVLVGFATFADVGRTFKPNEDFSLRDYYSSVGAGLRMSLEKASQSQILRFDVSLNNDQQVTFSFGTGQYF
jgi:hypothetical protein